MGERTGGEQPEALAQSIRASGVIIDHAPRDTDLVLAASAILRMRRRRDRHLPADLFAEPAWDILLELFIAGERRQPVTVTQACSGSGVPTTTALRWIKLLEQRGCLARARHEHDGRIVYLSLTPESREAMQALLRDLSGMRDGI